MLVKVKVIPASKTDTVTEKSPDTFIVSVKAKAREGCANAAALGLLADYLKIPPKRLKIIKGSKKRNKIVNIY